MRRVTKRRDLSPAHTWKEPSDEFSVADKPPLVLVRLRTHGSGRHPLLAACSSGSSPAATGGGSTGKATRKLKITLQWVAQAQFAGVYVAKAKGYFDDEGIDLTIQPVVPMSTTCSC